MNKLIIISIILDLHAALTFWDYRKIRYDSLKRYSKYGFWVLVISL